MKKRNMFTVLATLFCVAAVTANVALAKHPNLGIQEQLQKILSDNSLSVDKGDATARVLFKVNQQGKIELLEIVSKRKDVRWFIDRKLDGKAIEVDDINLGEVFVVNVRITS
ncbi:MAG: hypothetical protein AAF717_01405 [Bacteroidota bacterium]